MNEKEEELSMPDYMSREELMEKLIEFKDVPMKPNRATRRKQLQELNRQEKKRRKEIYHVMKDFEKKHGNEYISEESAMEFLTMLYRGEK